MAKQLRWSKELVKFPKENLPRQAYQVSEALLEKGATKPGRKKSNRWGFKVSTREDLWNWVNMADLFRIKGVAQVNLLTFKGRQEVRYRDRNYGTRMAGELTCSFGKTQEEKRLG